MLPRGEQLAHGPFVAPAQQLDRVGIAVHDRLEEHLALLVGGERVLGPCSEVVQQLGEARVWLAELLGDLALQALRERRARARRRDRDRDRAVAHDRRHDEVAERRHVDDVHEHRAALRLAEHLHVQVGVRGRSEHEQRALEIARLEAAPVPARASPPPRARRPRGRPPARRRSRERRRRAVPRSSRARQVPAPMTTHARSRTFMKVGKNVVSSRSREQEESQ